MAKTLTIDPITRVEGHLAIRVEVEGGRVAAAYSSGEMFRGIEMILQGRDPLDAQQITQRICGVCPISHGMASVRALDVAFGIRPAPGGRMLRNLIQAANYIQSHILHFYHLCALDFVDITAILRYQGKDPALRGLREWVEREQKSNQLYPAAPFLPRYEGEYLKDTEANLGAIAHYLEALRMRALAHEAAALFGGKIPHATGLVPGGVTEGIRPDNIAGYRSRIQQLRTFIDQCYLPDVVAVAGAFPDYFKIGKGCGNFLSFGVFPETDEQAQTLLPPGVLVAGRVEALDAGQITEDVRYSLFSSRSGLKPEAGETRPDPEKSGAYSWLKAPRYRGLAVEVGPLARLMVACAAQDPRITPLVGDLARQAGVGLAALDSVMGRHAARALECKLIADRCAEWIDALTLGEPTCLPFTIPREGTGMGLTEAPRGALGHWIQIRNKKIANYQCVVPTTWNMSPRDDHDLPGPVEQALVGTPVTDAANPLEAARVVRSFDPCIACAVH